MKKALLGMLAAGCMLFAFTTTASAQTKKTTKVVKVTQQTVNASRGANPNIKSNAPTTDNPEPQARGANTCKILFTNYTGYYINVYVDGYYRGQLSPYGSGTVFVADGYTTIYGLSAGGTVEWPTQAGNCYGYYTYGFY